MQFYPINTLALTISAMNQRLATIGKSKTGTGEFFRFLGIRLIMALEPRRGGYPAYWKSEWRTTKSSFSSIDMEELSGIDFERFKDLTSCLAFCDEHNGITPEDVS